ncbi:hypothetical protein MUK42_33042 [Musa troglodytarum]|uniref:Secretory carrier-associated membrane protein n=1 Tax=Musa troglodytarum TaxID=320322 RepID=A0A9E7EZU7_9LILI|nr:hypothetical protein MUK42_33042 [Musa troglodytarum]
MAGRYDSDPFQEEDVNPFADLKKKERELQVKEAELDKREKLALLWMTKIGHLFFPIIHHDIASEIPVHLQRLQYLAFASLLGLTACLFWNVIVVTTAWIKREGFKIWFLAIIYFISGVPGDALDGVNFTIISSQKVYSYFRGSGKTAETKREAARGAMRAAI